MDKKTIMPSTPANRDIAFLLSQNLEKILSIVAGDVKWSGLPKLPVLPKLKIENQKQIRQCGIAKLPDKKASKLAFKLSERFLQLPFCAGFLIVGNQFVATCGRLGSRGPVGCAG